MKRTCGTWESHIRRLKSDPAYRLRYLENQRFIARYVAANRGTGLRSGVITIPTVVHVVYNTPVQNVSDARIQTQIDVLNKDFRKLNTDIGNVPSVFAPLAADARIQFKLAIRDPSCHATTGITRTSTTTTAFDIFGSDAVKSAATGGANPWPADKYMNIWVCPAMAGQLGRATFPGEPAATDGLICAVRAFGTTGSDLYPNFALGRTATHEISHYLDLHHIWGDDSNQPDPCSGSDLVNDTPNQGAENYGVPTFPHVSCKNGPNGDMFMNYMDYVDDAAMVMFTAGQAARMEATLAGPRASLLASDGLVAPPSPDVIELWSADTPADVGNEPDAESSVFYVSDDIWVRNQADGIAHQEHQDPAYGHTNYVYVRVRNRSCGMAATGNLKLYWAKASSALGWPAPWDGSVTTPVLMGGLIGAQSTGSIPGRGSTILQYSWSPPNPADYASFGGDRNHFCLLARTETSATAPFGMTFPETGDLWANVRNNARIVWKNVTVVTGGARAEVMTAAVTIANPNHKLAQDIHLALQLPKHDRALTGAQIGALHVQFTPVLAQRIRQHATTLQAKNQPLGVLAHAVLATPAGRSAAGTPLPLIVPITKLGDRLGPVPLEPQEHHTIEVKFTPPERFGVAGVATFDLVQYDAAGNPIGGQRLVFKRVPDKQFTPLPALFGKWLRVPEGAGEQEVYRLADQPLPPARGRSGFEIASDGSAKRLSIGPGDGVVEEDGFWYPQDDGIVLDFSITGHGRHVLHYDVKSGPRLMKQ